MVYVRDELEHISFGLCLIPLALAVSDEEDLNKESNSEMWGKKGCATYGRSGLVWVEKFKYPTDSAPKKELNSEMWGKKGACDIWEKWACLGGEIKYSAQKKN